MKIICFVIACLSVACDASFCDPTDMEYKETKYYCDKTTTGTVTLTICDPAGYYERPYCRDADDIVYRRLRDCFEDHVCYDPLKRRID
jgi:hypothetical protein